MKLSNKDRLRILISIAGGHKLLALMLGVKPGTIYQYAAQGQITATGTLLVERSVMLRKFFDREFLRPDLHSSVVSLDETRKPFLKARSRQIANEETRQKTFEKSPVWYLIQLKNRAQ